MTAAPRIPARKIVFYTHGLTTGGAERVFALLASGFAARGDDVTMAVDYEASANAGFLDPRVKLVVLGGGHAANVLALRRLILREEPDVTFSALGTNNLKHAIAAIAAGRGRHAVLTYHGDPIDEPGGWSRVGNGLTPFTTRLTARTVCVSDGLRGIVLAREAGSPRRTVRIYNPVVVDGAVPARSAEELLARAPSIIAVGRLVPQKGYHQLLHAFRDLDHPEKPTLTILGDGPQRPALEAEIVRLGLSERVTLAGYASEPWSYYRAARVLALPSRSEAFGNVVVEGLAHGLRIVATDCVGPLEILEHGRYGRIVPRQDLGALTRALGDALSDRSDPALAVARAQDFSIARAVERYAALIEEVIAEAPHDGSGQRAS